MESTAYIHPAPTLARRIQGLLWTSVCFCVVVLAFSLSTLSQFSLWITPSIFVLSISHNITLLVRSAKERKQTAEARDGKLPATATKASIICSSILAFFWCGAVATFTLVCVISIVDLDGGPYNAIGPWFEWIFALFEVVTLIILAVTCAKERRAIIGKANSATLELMKP